MTDPALGLPDELGGTTGSLADTAGGLTQTAGESAEQVGSPGVGLVDSPVQPLLGLPNGDAAATDTNPFLGGTDTTVEPVIGAGQSHGIDESAGSLLDSIANGLSSSAAVYGRAAALVLLLGLMAARLSATMTAVAAYATAGVGESVRTGWLTSWGSARCLVVNASRAVAVPFASAFQGAPSPASAGGQGRPVRRSGGGALGAFVRRRPPWPFQGHLGPRGIPGSVKGAGLADFLRVLLWVAGGLLALAAVPARMLGRGRLLVLSAPLKLSFAVAGVSTLLVVGIVLLSAP